MITKMYNRAHLLTQTCSDECGAAEPAIGISTDACDTVVLTQEGRYITLDVEFIPELCKLLRKIQKMVEEGES
jgi:hypothetical protein